MTRIELKYLFLIIVIFVTACIETDIYLPAFADMIQAFQVSEEAIQKLLTWNFFGICISCPIYGPLSDSFGRKKPLLAALGLFFAGSIMTIFAESFDLMLWGRLLQGLGSGGCFTLGTAIIFDSFQAEKAIWAMNKLNVIIPLIMGGAPLLGGFLNLSFGFRSNFIAIAIFVLLSLVVTILFLEETLPKEKRSELKPQKLFTDFKTVLTSVPFWQLCGVVSLIYGGYLAFLSGTAVLFVVEFGMAKSLFPLYQGAILAAWVIGSLTCDRALQKWGNKKLKKIGSILFFIGGVGIGITALLFPRDPNLITFFMFLFTFGANWASGLYYGESMEVFPDMKGIAASILTSARLLFSALAIAAVGKLYNATIYPIAGAVCLTVACSLPLIFFYERKNLGKATFGATSITH
jgi:DHA1 family bicyclomycin/chloramphenicol resistance-like MFS transporter